MVSTWEGITACVNHVVFNCHIFFFNISNSESFIVRGRLTLGAKEDRTAVMSVAGAGSLRDGCLGVLLPGDPWSKFMGNSGSNGSNSKGYHGQSSGNGNDGNGWWEEKKTSNGNGWWEDKSSKSDWWSGSGLRRLLKRHKSLWRQQVPC